MITPLRAFEEIRFAVELMSAELLFAFPACKKADYFWLKSIVGFLAGIALSFGYFLVLWLLELCAAGQIAINLTVGIWYIFFTSCTLLYLRLSFKLPLSEVIFRGIAAYALQHIEYVLVNEMFALGLWPELRDTLWLYVLISAASCAALYWLAYVLLHEKFYRIERVMVGSSAKSSVFYFLLLTVLISSAMMEQYLFRYAANGSANYIAGITDIMCCLLVLALQYCLCYINKLDLENGIIEQLFYENQEQYDSFKDTVELINAKCHNLKHQIAALKNMPSEARDSAIGEIENAVKIYDLSFHTKNEVLNTILTEKSMFCEKNKIRLTYVGDGAELDFISTIDLCTLFGNAIDNAIECVSQYPDEEQRVISVTIHKQGKFVAIQMNNCFYGKLKIKDGLPVTSKKDVRYHGFGMKSIRKIAEKYSGTMLVSTDNNIFTLQILLLNPEE